MPSPLDVGSWALEAPLPKHPNPWELVRDPPSLPEAIASAMSAAGASEEEFGLLLDDMEVPASRNLRWRVARMSDDQTRLAAKELWARAAWTGYLAAPVDEADLERLLDELGAPPRTDLVSRVRHMTIPQSKRAADDMWRLVLHASIDAEAISRPEFDRELDAVDVPADTELDRRVAGMTIAQLHWASKRLWGRAVRAAFHATPHANLQATLDAVRVPADPDEDRRWSNLTVPELQRAARWLWSQALVATIETTDLTATGIERVLDDAGVPADTDPSRRWRRMTGLEFKRATKLVWGSLTRPEQPAQAPQATQPRPTTYNPSLDGTRHTTHRLDGSVVEKDPFTGLGPFGG